jgi:hypothetical protein
VYLASTRSRRKRSDLEAGRSLFIDSDGVLLGRRQQFAPP